jgi:peptide/nickel transport system substrate-binding protein
VNGRPIAFLLAACVVALAPFPVESRGGRLVFALSGGPDTLDPQRTAATLAFQVMKSLYDTLVEPDDHGVLVPGLAESWAMTPDGKQWTFKIKPGVRFHTGKAADAQDVVATFTRILDPKTASPKRPDFAAIDRVEAVDSTAIRFVLKQPFAPFLAALGQGWGAILPRDAIASGHDFGKSPIGTGPFKLEEWSRDSFLRLGRFDGYFVKGAPVLDGVTFRFVSEAPIRTAGLLGGEFDVVDSVDPLDVPRLVKDPRVTVAQRQNATVNVVAVNNARKPFNDVRVRRALWHAIDRKVVLKTAYGAGSTPVAVFMDVLSPYYVDLGDPYPYSPAKAKELLAEAGLGSGFAADLALPQPYAAHIKAGELVQAMLAQVGIQAKIRVVEFGFWLSQIFTGAHDYDLTIIGHTGKLDPDGRLSGYGDPGVRTNYVNYHNPRVVALIDAGRFTLRADLRKRTYTDVLRAMTQDAMMVFLGDPEDRLAMRKGVQNVREMYAIDTYDLRTASK